MKLTPTAMKTALQPGPGESTPPLSNLHINLSCTLVKKNAQMNNELFYYLNYYKTNKDYVYKKSLPI